ncbi:hypothetical protein LOD99_1455 [Oopsacas minuta]|uniref:Uncharacterized protein n=1 Tax=Oopsacas minuta TaxID=111878 RepID=A0AAV7K4E8_9METZ|nr:hypothetical protein LOD99_1455 [Oopsacas minuta]
MNCSFVGILKWMTFHSLQMKIDPPRNLLIVFEEDFSRVSRKHISELSHKGMRYRLANLRLHLEAVAQREEVSPKMISSYLLLLYSQEEHDVSTANISKNVIAGSHGLGNFNRKLSLDSSCFLLDSLEIGKSKIHRPKTYIN